MVRFSWKCLAVFSFSEVSLGFVKCFCVMTLRATVVIKGFKNEWNWSWTNYVLSSNKIQSYLIRFDTVYFLSYCILFDIALFIIWLQQLRPALLFTKMTIQTLFLCLFLSFLLFNFSPENRHISVYDWTILIWITQQQTPTLVGSTLSYQSRGSYFDLADNTESVMMFSVEHPLWSDCGPCLLVLFRSINLTAEWSGLLLPLFSIQIIFQSISLKV